MGHFQWNKEQIIKTGSSLIGCFTANNLVELLANDDEFTRQFGKHSRYRAAAKTLRSSPATFGPVV